MREKNRASITQSESRRKRYYSKRIECKLRPSPTPFDRSIGLFQIPVFEYSSASLPELSRQSVVALEEVSASGRDSCSSGVKERSF